MARVFTDAGAQTLASASQTTFMVDTFSIAFWLFRTATPGATVDVISSTLSGPQGGWGIQILISNLIRGIYPGATTNKVRDSSTAPALNTWVHVVVTHLQTGNLSTDWLFYFDGKQEAGTNNASLSGAHPQTAAPLIIGQNSLLGNRSPPAQLGPIAFWSRAITPAECLALAGGAHPIRFREGLVEMFEMQTAHGELGLVSNTYLVQGATNPTSAAVNPVLEPIPSSLYVNRQNYRTRRARYNVDVVLGSRPKVHRLSQAVKRSAYY